MIVYLNADGTIQQVIPQNLTQGSNNETLIVVGANISNYTSLSAIFKLPNKQVLAPYLMTKQNSNYVLNNEIVNVWTCGIDRPVTNFSGTLEITIDATDVNGVKVNSYNGAVQIAPTNAPVFPTIDQSAEEIFNQIYQAYGFIQGKLEEKQDINDDSLETNAKNIVGAINEVNAKETENAGDIVDLQGEIEDIKNGNTIVGKATNDQNGDNIVNTYQKKQDNSLGTVNKTVVGGINELKNQTVTNAEDIQQADNEIANIKDNYATKKFVNDLYGTISMGGSKSFVFTTMQQFLDWLDGTYTRPDSVTPQNLNIGDIILIVDKGVPDYWVKSKSTPMTINDFAEYEAKVEVQEITIDDESITENESGDLQAVALKNGLKKINTTISLSDFKGMVHLSEAQYQELVTYGTISVGGQTITFDEGTIYVTPDQPAPMELTLSGTSVLTSEETFTNHIQIMVEFETDSIHAGFDCVLHPYDEAVCFVTYDVLVNGQANFGTAYLNENGNIVINVPSGLTFTNVHAKYVEFGG